MEKLGPFSEYRQTQLVRKTHRRCLSSYIKVFMRKTSPNGFLAANESQYQYATWKDTCAQDSVSSEYMGGKERTVFFRIKKHQHFVAAKKVRNMCLDKLTSWSLCFWMWSNPDDGAWVSRRHHGPSMKNSWNVCLCLQLTEGHFPHSHLTRMEVYVVEVCCCLQHSATFAYKSASNHSKP